VFSPVLLRQRARRTGAVPDAAIALFTKHSGVRDSVVARRRCAIGAANSTVGVGVSIAIVALLIVHSTREDGFLLRAVNNIVAAQRIVL
jgi:hypothetical protein